MKKALNLKITLCILVFVYAIILVSLLVMFGERIKESWFALALGFLGLYLIKKSMLMNSDSALWLGVLLTLTGFSVILAIFVPKLSGQILLLLSVCVALASFVVFLAWQNAAHLYLFVSTILGVIPALFYSFKLVNFWWFLVLVAGVYIVNFVIYKMFILIFTSKG